MGNPFDWDLLRCFLAVARTGRLTSGAKLLRIDHSTLSRRIGALEQALGAQLFEHSVTGYSLTSHGERLLSYAESIESSVYSLDTAFGQEARISGSVRIGAPDGFGTAVLAPALRGLSMAHPELEVELIALPRVFSLSKREADIAFAMSCPPRGRLHGRKLTDFEVGVYAAKAHPELWEGVRTPDQLAESPFIGYIEDYLYAPELDIPQEISKAIKPRIRCSTLVAQWQATVAGAGLCVLPYFLANEDDRLVRVLPDEVVLKRTYWMIVHSDLRETARIKVTCDFLVDQVRSLRPKLLPRG
jgi:DNA-binding transcriptional LysR family regulator